MARTDVKSRKMCVIAFFGLLLGMVSPVRAADNQIFVQQVGSSNLVSIGQSFADTGSVDISQNGNDNAVDADSVRNNLTLSVSPEQTILLSGPSAGISQSGAGNLLTSLQDGSGNRFLANQNGNSNQAQAIQFGTGNIGALIQAGNGHDGTIRQNGSENQAVLSQNGAANQGELQQNGNQNALSLEQNGQNQGRIIQNGNGLSLGIVQQAGGPAVNIIQNQ